MRRQKQEESVHVAIAAYIRAQYPNVLFTSESSGIRVPMHLAVMMKKQRSTHKQPDMIVLHPKGIFHGLILEIKKDHSEVFLKDGSISKKAHIQEQNNTLVMLRELGYCAMFACGFDDAKNKIDGYMGLD
jgi:hypothetical protein